MEEILQTLRENMERAVVVDPTLYGITSAATAIVGLIKGDTQSSAMEPAATLSPDKRARVSGQYLEHLERLQFKEQITFILSRIFDG